MGLCMCVSSEWFESILHNEVNLEEFINIFIQVSTSPYLFVTWFKQTAHVHQ